MKNILTIVLISLSILSCKEDSKKATAETHKTKTTEIRKKTMKTDLKKKPLAISDNAGVYKLKFKLEPGKTYPFTTVQSDVQNMKDHTGKSILVTQEIIDNKNILINSFENNIYSLSINILRKKMSSKSEGETVIIDTDKPAPKEEHLKELWTINKALAGSQLHIKMKENGEILSIKGFEPIYKKVKSAIHSLKKDEKTSMGFLEEFKTTFNENTIKTQFENNINILPKEGVKINESWTRSENLTPDGKIRLNTTYTLTKVDDKLAEITIKGNIPEKSDKQTQGNITMTMNIKGTQKGNIIIDSETGWIQKSNINIKTASKTTMTDGKITESMSQTSNASIKIN